MPSKMLASSLATHKARVMNDKLSWTLSILLCHSLVSVCFADNPIVQTMYTADPAPLVHDGTFYVYTGHDEDGATWFNMKEWRVFSTTDMANWTDLGSPMNLATFSWAASDAWAGQCVFRNGKFYYYVPMRPKSGGWAIGVAIATNPAGPFADALGHPLVSNNDFYIDPTVFIDDDGQAYMYWGNPYLYKVKLNEDMVSTSGDITQIPQTAETVANTYGEGPWLFKRSGLYYLIFSSDGNPNENIRYSTSSSPTGPWAYKGVIMPAEGKSWTNHAGVADYKGNSYFVYHNAALPGGGAGTRSVCVEQFNYSADGAFPTIKMTQTGPKQIGHLNPFDVTQAETIAFSSGLKTEKCNDSGGGVNVTLIHNGDYIKVNGVDFGTGATTFEARVASGTTTGGSIELHLDSLTGPLIGTCAVQGTGGAQTWATKSCAVTGATGIHDLFFKFTGSGSGALFNFNWWKFSGPGAAENTGDAGVSDAAGTSDAASASDAAGTSDAAGSPDAANRRDAGGLDGSGGDGSTARNDAGANAGRIPTDAGASDSGSIEPREGDGEPNAFGCEAPGSSAGGSWLGLGLVIATVARRLRRSSRHLEVENLPPHQSHGP
jgi:arabinoxylan arabinofuranohydrolase